jgi:hypothetical protein
MRTVKWLIEQLSKYPEDALCYAYEGEDTGVVIVIPGRGSSFIRCKEIEDEDEIKNVSSFDSSTGDLDGAG